MSRNRLHLLLGLAFLSAYSWLAWSVWHTESHPEFTPCIFKNVTGIACPSCGTTRSIETLMRGNFKEAALLNPLGIIAGFLLLTLPLWLLWDLAFKKNSLYINYHRAENTLKTKWGAVTFTLLIIANWIWNINKGL